MQVAFLPTDHRDRVIRYARIELEAVLAWIEHWQRDVAAGLKPTETSLATVARNIKQTLGEMEKRP